MFYNNISTLLLVGKNQLLLFVYSRFCGKVAYVIDEDIHILSRKSQLLRISLESIHECCPNLGGGRGSRNSNISNEGHYTKFGHGEGRGRGSKNRQKIRTSFMDGPLPLSSCSPYFLKNILLVKTFGKTLTSVYVDL